MAISPDGKRVVSGGYDKILIVWDEETGQVKHVITGRAGVVFAVAWSPDGHRIVSGSRDNTLKVWDAVTGEAKVTIGGQKTKSLVPGRFSAMAYSGDGKRIASGSADGSLKMWDAQTRGFGLNIHINDLQTLLI